MKKHLAFLLAVLMIFSLVACGAGEKEKDSAPPLRRSPTAPAHLPLMRKKRKVRL